METSLEVLSFKKNEKIEVYDWLRGMASLAVILGHFKPFGISKVYFVWSVHAFILVTAVLISKKSFGFEKLLKRLTYLTFIYLSLLLIFRPLFIFQHVAPVIPVWNLIFNPMAVFLENPYFAHLWYLVIYAQLLFSVYFFQNWFKKWEVRWVLITALILSNFSYIFFKDYPVVLLPSWFFTIAVGMYLLPKITLWIEKSNKYRILRSMLSFTLLAFILTRSELREWLILPDARVSLLSTLIYFLCIYFVMELFFIVSWFPRINFFRKFIFLVSRYTLTLYIYHQALGRLLLPYGISMEVLTPLAVISGIFLGFLLHQGFLALERFFAATVFFKQVPIPR